MKLRALLVPALLSSLPVLAAGPELEIRIVYDNTSTRPDLRADWGFAAIVDHNSHRVLFDSGMKPDLFAKNLQVMGIDPASIEQAVISHAHADHANGISAIGGKNPNLMVYEPDGSETPFLVRTGIHSTGMVKGTPPEQALVIETSKGLVVLTGCCHPGVVRMVEAARAQHGNKPVRLLVGGFHMLEMKPDQMAATVARLRELQVASVVPTHCTGALAIKQFLAVFGSDVQPGGAGRQIVLE